jgi:hypothetical protein
MALFKVATKDIWLKQILQNLGFSQVDFTTFYSNNQNVIASQPKFHSKSEHVDMQYHFTCKTLQAKRI